LRYTDQLEVELLDLGPSVSVGGVQLGPDEVIALEGVGTFSMVNLEMNLKELQEKGRTLGSSRGRYTSSRRGEGTLP